MWYGVEAYDEWTALFQNHVMWAECAQVYLNLQREFAPRRLFIWWKLKNQKIPFMSHVKVSKLYSKFTLWYIKKSQIKNL